MADMNQFRYPGTTLSTTRAALPASLSLHPFSTFSFPDGEHHLHFNMIGTTSFFQGRVFLCPPLWTAARAVSHRFYGRHYLFSQTTAFMFNCVVTSSSFVGFFRFHNQSEFLPYISAQTDSGRLLGRHIQSPPPPSVHQSVLSSLCLAVRVVGPLPN